MEINGFIAFTEGAGRRPLLIISTLFSMITLAVLGVYLMFNANGTDVSSVNLLPVIDVIIFQVFYQLGLGKCLIRI